MGKQSTFTRTRVIKGRDWSRHVEEVSNDLEAHLRTQAEGQDLVVDTISEVTIEPGTDSAWARLTRTATAHSV